MILRGLALWWLVIIPGVITIAICTYYLFPEWITLTASYQEYQKLAQSATVTDTQLIIAKAAEDRHRINCFAEGVGILGGLIVTAIGIHGLCTLPKQPFRSR